MIHPAEAPICRESRRLTRALQETMQSEEEVLEEWATRSGLDEIRLFSQTCSICRRTGGNLEQALAKANRILTSRIEAENGVQSLLKQKRLEVCILLAVPLCLLFLLQTASPEYMEDLYETGNGRILMTAALAALIGAYIWSESMIRKIFFTEKPLFHIRIPFGKKVKA